MTDPIDEKKGGREREYCTIDANDDADDSGGGVLFIYLPEK